MFLQLRQGHAMISIYHLQDKTTEKNTGWSSWLGGIEGSKAGKQQTFETCQELFTTGT